MKLRGPFAWGFWGTLGHFAAKAALWLIALAAIIAVATCLPTP